MKLTAVIVDDEKLARNLIREYLATHPEIEIVAECKDGKKAIQTINGLRPDMIFLDVQMPEYDGFQVLESLLQIPRVVFTTAYEKYAIKAFEVSAVDYLLKPFTQERFDQAVSRVLNHGTQSEEMANKMIALMEAIQKERRYAQRLFIKLRGRVVPVDVTEIEWIEAQDDYAEVHTQNNSYLTSQNLTGLESLLAPQLFVRIHRSSLVNINYIRELHRADSGNYVVRMVSGKELSVGRTRVDQLKEWMV
jgi:two-component system LytT family response regulator